MSAQAPSSQPPLIWVVAYPYGLRRIGDRKERRQCRLPDDSWFSELAASAGVSCDLAVHSRGGDFQKFVCKGLAVLERGALQATLAPRSAQLELQWRYHGRPLDAYSCVVKKFFACVDAVSR